MSDGLIERDIEKLMRGRNDDERPIEIQMTCRDAELFRIVINVLQHIDV